jgi:hypothetical protein
VNNEEKLIYGEKNTSLGREINVLKKKTTIKKKKRVEPDCHLSTRRTYSACGNRSILCPET